MRDYAVLAAASKPWTLVLSSAAAASGDGHSRRGTAACCVMRKEANRTRANMETENTESALLLHTAKLKLLGSHEITYGHGHPSSMPSKYMYVRLA